MVQLIGYLFSIEIGGEIQHLLSLELPNFFFFVIKRSRRNSSHGKYKTLRSPLVEIANGKCSVIIVSQAGTGGSVLAAAFGCCHHSL